MYAPRLAPRPCSAPSNPSCSWRADEKNERSKALIRTKIEEYLARAEMLKQHIQAADSKTKRAVGANGAGSKKAYVRPPPHPRSRRRRRIRLHLTPAPPARTATRTSRTRR